MNKQKPKLNKTKEKILSSMVNKNGQKNAILFMQALKRNLPKEHQKAASLYIKYIKNLKLTKFGAPGNLLEYLTGKKGEIQGSMTTVDDLIAKAKEAAEAAGEAAGAAKARAGAEASAGGASNAPAAQPAAPLPETPPSSSETAQPGGG